MILVPYAHSPSGNMNNFVMHVNPAMKNQPPPNFQLSNCNVYYRRRMDLYLVICVGQGRKRALLIGINYFRSPNELKGRVSVSLTKQ